MMIEKEKSSEFNKQFNDVSNKSEGKTSRATKKEGLKNMCSNNEVAIVLSKSHMVINMNRNNNFAILGSKITYVVPITNPSTNKREIVSYLQKSSIDSDWEAVDGSLTNVAIDLIKDNPKEIVVCNGVSETLTAQLILGDNFSMLGTQFKDIDIKISTNSAEKIKELKRVIFLSKNLKLFESLKLINPNVEEVDYTLFSTNLNISTLPEMFNDIVDNSKKGEDLIEKAKNLLIDKLNLTLDKNLEFKNMPTNKLKPHPSNKKLLSALSTEAYNGLKTRVKEHSFIEPIEVIKNPDESYTILDGHNRVKIAKELDIKEVPCSIIETDNPEKYIIDKNINRRQMGEKEQSLLRATWYENNKNIIGTNQHSNLSKENNPKSTIEKASEEFGVSKSTIARDVELKKSIDKIEDEYLKQDVISDNSITKTEIKKIAEVEPEKRKEFVDKLKNSKTNRKQTKLKESEDTNKLKVFNDHELFLKALENDEYSQFNGDFLKLFFGEKSNSLNTIEDKSVKLILIDILNLDELELVKIAKKKLKEDGKILLFLEPSILAKTNVFLDKNKINNINTIILCNEKPNGLSLNYNIILKLNAKNAIESGYNFLPFINDELEVGEPEYELRKSTQLLEFVLNKETTANESILELSISHEKTINICKQLNRQLILIEDDKTVLETIINKNLNLEESKM